MKLNSSNQERWQQQNERSGYSQNQGAVSPIGTSQTSRCRVTNLSARTKTLSSNNASSMKKLNDLIFTIKMTKEEYHDFMVIKKNLDKSNINFIKFREINKLWLNYIYELFTFEPSKVGNILNFNESFIEKNYEGLFRSFELFHFSGSNASKVIISGDNPCALR